MPRPRERRRRGGVDRVAHRSRAADRHRTETPRAASSGPVRRPAPPRVLAGGRRPAAHAARGRPRGGAAEAPMTRRTVIVLAALNLVLVIAVVATASRPRADGERKLLPGVSAET